MRHLIQTHHCQSKVSEKHLRIAHVVFLYVISIDELWNPNQKHYFLVAVQLIQQTTTIFND